MTRQPVWKLVANLGDVNPIEHGGYFVYVDETGVYGPEAERWEPKDGLAYRVLLERYAVYQGRLIPYSIAQADPASLPHPKETYGAWFDDEALASAACSADATVAEVARWLCSEDPLDLARGHEVFGLHYGWGEFDEDPLRLTKPEAARRYGYGKE